MSLRANPSLRHGSTLDAPEEGHLLSAEGLAQAALAAPGNRTQLVSILIGH